VLTLSELEIGVDTFGDRTRTEDGKKVVPRVHELLAENRRTEDVAQPVP
jgi:hypothetical protein